MEQHGRNFFLWELVNYMEAPSILCVDPDPEFLEQFNAEDAKGLVRFFTAESRQKAQLVIAEKKNFIAAMVFNINACDPLAAPLIRFAKAHRPATPVYLLLDENDPDPEVKILQSLHVSHAFRKPIAKQEIIDKIFPYTFFEAGKALDIGKQDRTPANAQVDAEDNLMHAISAVDFLCGSTSYFDVYVRLNSGRYIKILKAGDSFDIKRVQEYLGKGITHFYIKREAQEVFLQYCDSLTGIILHKKEFAEDIKVRQVANYGKETMDFLISRGIDAATIQTAQQFVKHANSLVKQLKPPKNPVLKMFLANATLCDHGTGISMLVGMMLDSLGFKDEKVISSLTLAAFLHDIGLVGKPPKLLEEDEEAMSEEELKIYCQHPIEGSEKAKTIRLINPIIPATILEHHERRTGGGFPNALGAGAISQISEVVAIADTFSRVIKVSQKDPSFDVVRHLQKFVYNEFSFPVIDAFQKTFGGVLEPPSKPPDKT